MQAANFFDVEPKTNPPLRCLTSTANEKNSRKRKLSVIFFSLLFLLGFSMNGLSQKVTLEGKNVSLEKILKSLEKQTEYKFFYKPDLLSTAKKVTINVKEMPVQEALDQLFADQPVTYRIYGKIITISMKPVPGKKEEISSDELRLMELTGQVIDAKQNIPLNGVSVTVSTTGKGTFTNAKGNYVLGSIEPAASISFSMIGYKTVMLPVTDMKALAVVKMEQTVNELDKVMVRAYGTTSLRNTTSDITRVSGEEIAKHPVTNPLLALQGRVPGLIITRTSGRANAPLKINLNGNNSLDPNILSEPLIVVDGNPMTFSDIGVAGTFGGFSRGIIQGQSLSGGQSPLYGMNPKDIESIEVLRDAGATAQYGARAANGVILITTKKGKSGKTSFSFGINQNVQHVIRQLKLPDTKEYLQIRREAFMNDGLIPEVKSAPDLLLWDTTRYTNWQKAVLEPGRGTVFNAGLSGGDTRTTFRLSTQFEKIKEINSPVGSNQVGSVSFQISHSNSTRKFNISLSGAYVFTKSNVLPSFTQYDLPPNAPPIYTSKGDPNYAEWNEAILAGANVFYPFGMLFQSNLMKTKAFSSSIVISYELLDNLKLSTLWGYRNANASSDGFIPIASQNPLNNPTGTAFFSQTGNDKWNIDPVLDYSRYVGRGRLALQLGGSLENAETNVNSLSGFGYTSDELIRSIRGAKTIQASQVFAMVKIAATFARINYDWEKKYFLEASFRREGSSRFAPGKQFGNFGSVGLAWIASEEKWLKNALPSWFSFLKVSSSYGLTGSDGGVNYRYLSRWSSTAINNVNLLFPEYNGIRPFNPTQAVNQQFQWSSTKTLKIGAQAGFLEDRITLHFNYNQSRSGDQIVGIPTPVFSGFSTVVANWPALISNSALSGSVLATLIRTKDFSWSASFNINVSKNRLIAYPGIETSPYSKRYKVGQSINTVYLYHYAGVDPQTGMYSIEDYNKDGAVKSNTNVFPGTVDDDRYIALDLTPRYSGGLNTDIRYKNFNLSLLFDFVNGKGARPFTNTIPGGLSNTYLPAGLYNKRWKKPGDQALYPRFTTAMDNTFFSQSDGAYADVSYVRLNNISFSYSLPEKWINKAGLQASSLSFQTNNLFFITPFEGLDPSMLNSTTTPSSRIYSCSLTLNF